MERVNKPPVLLHIQMVKIYNSELTRGLAKNAGIQQARDKTPDEIAEKIVPVIETNPELLRKVNIVRHAAATNAVATTIYSTSSTRDFYLCGCSLSVIKDATSTSLYSAIQIFIEDNPNAYRPLTIAELSLTAQSESMYIEFERPIRITRNTNISVINSTNVANITAYGAIWGYEVDNPYNG